MDPLEKPAQMTGRYSLHCVVWASVLPIVLVYMLFLYATTARGDDTGLTAHDTPLEGLEMDMTDRSLDRVAHVAVCCAGSKATQCSVLLHSLAFNKGKNTRLALHLFCHDDDRPFLLDFLRALRQEFGVQGLLYAIEPLLSASRDVLHRTRATAIHYSGLYTVAKIFVADFLPPSVQEFILLDSDTIILDDAVGMIQAGNSSLGPRAFISMGCAPDQARLDNYCKYRKDNCHTSLYCISAPYYLDRARMLSNGWANMSLFCLQTLQDMTVQYGPQNLPVGDQDIFNRAIASHPDAFGRLPCVWTCNWSNHGGCRDDPSCKLLHFSGNAWGTWQSRQPALELATGRSHAFVAEELFVLEISRTASV